MAMLSCLKYFSKSIKNPKFYRLYRSKVIEMKLREVERHGELVSNNPNGRRAKLLLKARRSRKGKDLERNFKIYFSETSKNRKTIVCIGQRLLK